MADRDELIEYCDKLLSSTAFDDYCPNGLQVPGTAAVNHVVTGVSATLELFERAATLGADMVLCHHGIFWNSSPFALTRQQANRIKALLLNDINLAAYHLPLDAHAEIGNNVLLARSLGFEPTAQFAATDSQPIGWIGRSEQPISVNELEARIAAQLGRKPLILGRRTSSVETVAVISGAAAGEFPKAIAAGVDAFITGEPAERVMAEADESGVTFIAAGHYATETLGIQQLGNKLSNQFSIQHTFVDLPNPI